MEMERGGRAWGGGAALPPPHGPGCGAHPEGSLGVASPKPAARLGFGTPGLFSVAPGTQSWGAEGPAEGLTHAWPGIHSPPGKRCQ